MSRFIAAPVPDEDTGIAETSTTWLAEIGIDTGLIGAGLLGLGAVFLLIGVIKIATLIYSRLAVRLTEGEVVAAQPADGAFHPVVRYTDIAGTTRRFVADMKVPTERVGQRVCVRIDGPRPVIAPRAPSPFSEALGMVVPLALGMVATTTGLTGRLAGLVPLPFF
ncbi:MAG: DUF3592 domain-containing protein [Pseudomonadota bacterium]